MATGASAAKHILLPKSGDNCGYVDVVAAADSKLWHQNYANEVNARCFVQLAVGELTNYFDK